MPSSTHLVIPESALAALASGTTPVMPLALGDDGRAACAG